MTSRPCWPKLQLPHSVALHIVYYPKALSVMVADILSHTHLTKQTNVYIPAVCFVNGPPGK